MTNRDSVSVSTMIAGLRLPPSKGNCNMQSLFPAYHHEKPHPIHNFTVDDEPTPEKPRPERRPRSGSEGLDFLAALAEKEWVTSSPSVVDEHVSTSVSSSDDEECMPPPLPRRPRSNSNPDHSLLQPQPAAPSGFLVLPAAFLKREIYETELAQARASRTSPPSIPEDAEWLETDATELLRETRSRLLEDLSQSSLQQQRSNNKSTSVLPHDLEKYKGVYNKNGRIGIYSPQERKAILARFHDKRQRRNWNKKIRYNCRKSLADRRVRVKGRFVKAEDMPDTSDPEAGFQPTEDQPYKRARRHTIT